MSRRLSRRAALGQLAVASLGACSGAGGQVLKLWAMGREGEVVQTLVPGFEKANPGVRVEVQQLPWSAAHAKLLTAFAGGSLPDLCQIGNTWLPEFVALRAVDRLDARIARSQVVRPADDFAGIWRTNVVDGGVYGVPWYVDTRLLFYRRDLVEQVGYEGPFSTWAQWLEALQAVQRRLRGAGYAVLLPLDEYEPLFTLALQQDDPLLRDQGGRGNFRSPGFIDALSFYADLFRRGLAPMSSDTQISNLYDEFARGRFAFLITGPWNLGEFRRRLAPAQQGSWMTAPMPGPSGPGASIAGGSSLVVFAGSRRKEAAWRLIEYLSQTPAQAEFWRLTGDLPARKDAWADPTLVGDVHAAAFRDQLERVRPAPQVPEWERIATEMQLVAVQCVLGRLTVAQAAAEIDRRADRLLEKRRWMLARGAAA